MFDDDYEYEEYEVRDDDYMDEDEDENALWDDVESETEDGDPLDSQSEQAQRQLAREQNLIEELEADAEAHPIEEDAADEEPERKKLKRELRAEALTRLEDAARTIGDFEKVVSWWDKLDANRERRERYHELSRSGDDVPLDYGVSIDELFFPDTLNDVMEKEIRNGDFIDAIFNCPYDIHELVTEEYLCEILRTLNEDHKEPAVPLGSPAVQHTDCSHPWTD